MANTISNQAHINPHALRQHNKQDVTPAPGQEKKADTPLQQYADSVVISQRSETSATYSSSINISGNLDKGLDMLRGLLLDVFKNQGIDTKIAAGDQEFDLKTITQDEAQQLIADDGYFGVEQTSDRIVDFAISLSGDDPARMEAIKEGVEKGFKEALEAFGGWLPDISYETYDTVFAKLDAWAEDNQAVQEA